MSIEKHTRNWLSEYNNIYRETDTLYGNAARSLGMSDCAFWILYALRDCGGTLTQKDICSMIHLPKQTVNSALKKLIADGFLTLEEINGRRGKQVLMTPQGEKLAQRTVDRVIALELTALEGLSEEERDLLVRLFRKYTDLLQKNFRLL